MTVAAVIARRLHYIEDLTHLDRHQRLSTIRQSADHPRQDVRATSEVGQQASKEAKDDQVQEGDVSWMDRSKDVLWEIKSRWMRIVKKKELIRLEQLTSEGTVVEAYWTTHAAIFSLWTKVAKIIGHYIGKTTNAQARAAAHLYEEREVKKNAGQAKLHYQIFSSS